MSDQTPEIPLRAWDWWREGLRTAFFRLPRCQGWPAASPSTVFGLMACVIAAGVVLERQAMEPPLVFNPTALASGWFGAILTLAVCWCVARGAQRGPQGPASADTALADPLVLPASSLFALSLVQTIVIAVLTSPVYIGLFDPLVDHLPDHADAVNWSLWLLPVGWSVLATGVLLWRQSMGQPALRAMIVAAAVLNVVASIWAPPPPYWYAASADSDSGTAAADAASTAADAGGPQLTQEAIEAQIDLLPTALDALQPRRPGVVNLYAITFAPFADADVFSREATLVSELMRSRFDADGRVVQLQNHASSLTSLPWATPLNLQRSIEHIAGLMDRDEDVLFIHLTSHGARDGHLAASLGPLQVDEVTPQQLNAWLDDAGIRHRVISISACYSGSWIESLRGPGSLVMTAADASHTSYGCGRKSELTFFGRAMYAEQLRQTRSFEEAFAAARPVIEQREKEAGKNDGYSNPQISVGPDARAALQRLRQRLDGEGRPAS